MLQQLCKKLQIPLFKNEPLAHHTTFKAGGKAHFFVNADSAQTLLCIVKAAQKYNVPFYILGGGSNVLFNDTDFNGAVICTSGINSIALKDSNTLECGCGVTFKQISEFCQKNGLMGLEEFSGLPGTAGGAVFMNARCYEKSISDVLSGAEYASLRSGTIKQYHFKVEEWDYKKSPFQTGEKIITKVFFKVNQAQSINEKNSILQKNLHFLNDRIAKKQFDFPCAGSVFKNNRSFGKPSGKIIDEAGLRGLQLGGAQVAPWHGNFIINVNSATAQDIKNLTQTVIERVKQKTGFELEPEIVFVGF